MAIVKFISLDAEARTVTMEVNGQQVVRGIAENVQNVDQYIEDLAKGLAQEANEPNPFITPETNTAYSPGDVVVEA